MYEVIRYTAVKQSMVNCLMKFMSFSRAAILSDPNGSYAEHSLRVLRAQDPGKLTPLLHEKIVISFVVSLGVTTALLVEPLVEPLVVSSVGSGLDCRAGGLGFKPQFRPTLRVLK